MDAVENRPANDLAMQRLRAIRRLRSTVQAIVNAVEAGKIGGKTNRIIQKCDCIEARP
jgi:hypothetical protein